MAAFTGVEAAFCWVGYWLVGVAGAASCTMVEI